MNQSKISAYPKHNANERATAKESAKFVFDTFQFDIFLMPPQFI